MPCQESSNILRLMFGSDHEYYLAAGAQEDQPNYSRTPSTFRTATGEMAKVQNKITIAKAFVRLGCANFGYLYIDLRARTCETNKLVQ